MRFTLSSCVGGDAYARLVQFGLFEHRKLRGVSLDSESSELGRQAVERLFPSVDDHHAVSVSAQPVGDTRSNPSTAYHNHIKGFRFYHAETPLHPGISRWAAIVQVHFRTVRQDSRVGSISGVNRQGVQPLSAIPTSPPRILQGGYMPRSFPDQVRSVGGRERAADAPE